MNENERWLLRYVCNGNLKQAQDQAKIILEGIKTQKDERFRDQMLNQLKAQHAKFIELPPNLKGLLVMEDVSDFPIDRFLIRSNEDQIASDTINLYRAAERLKALAIPYLPALILHGQSGCGKTMLARYIAYKAKLPFAYVKFSNLVGSYLGNTQSNIARIFEYVHDHPCVLCFDEIDAIGMARGQKNDVGEMNRIVIALMQEMDQIPNDVIIVGTTNRYDRLDPALVRRFPLNHEVQPLTFNEAKTLARSFFAYSQLDCSEWLDQWFDPIFQDQIWNGSIPASDVIRECTAMVVRHVIKDVEKENNQDGSDL